MAQQDEGGPAETDLQAKDAKAVLTTGNGEDAGGGTKDDLEGGTTGAASMSGGDWRGVASGSAEDGGNAVRSEAAPGGRVSPAGEELGPIGMESASGGPTGDPGKGGASANGSFASGTYNERGNVTGADSPAGADAAPAVRGEGQGDDLANRLGGGDNARTGLAGAGAATGDMDADRSEAAGASPQTMAGGGGPSAGDVGGMGGVRGGTAGSDRPPGGMSPIQADRD